MCSFPIHGCNHDKVNYSQTNSLQIIFVTFFCVNICALSCYLCRRPKNDSMTCGYIIKEGFFCSLY